MNTYGAWGPPQTSQLPPTPPEYQPYWNGEMMAADQSYYKAAQDFHGRGQSGREFIDRFTQGVNAPPTYARNTPTHAQAFNSYDQRRYMQPTELATQYAFGPKMTHPTMHPHYASRPTERKVSNSKRKEDAPKGGVAARLDYDLDVMANFVAEMSQKL